MKKKVKYFEWGNEKPGYVTTWTLEPGGRVRSFGWSVGRLGQQLGRRKAGRTGLILRPVRFRFRLRYGCGSQMILRCNHLYAANRSFMPEFCISQEGWFTGCGYGLHPDW